MMGSYLPQHRLLFKKVFLLYRQKWIHLVLRKGQIPNYCCHENIALQQRDGEVYIQIVTSLYKTMFTF